MLQLFAKICLVMLLISGGGSLLASEIDSLREKAKAMRAKALVLAEQGNRDQAERLEMEAIQLLKMADRQESKANGKGEQRPEFRAQMEKLELATRRIHHFRVAAENLKMAEEHDLAHKLMERAADMERDVHAAKHKLAAEMNMGSEKKKPIGHDAVEQLKEEIERLRAEVRELKLHLEKR